MSQIKMLRSNMKILFYLLASLAASKAADLRTLYSPEELSNIHPSVLEDARLNFEGLARKYGYPFQEHFVTTEDGYILQIHRIPYGKRCHDQNITRVPILVGHGILSHSVDFIIMGPEQGLGYILADECFDVWFSNARGTRESREHVSLSVKDRKYWEFSWHELGVYDLPAMIDYILETTGQPSLHYLGYSQGTTQFFVFGSMRPEYAKKIRSAHMFSPVAFMKNVKSPLVRFLLLFKDPLQAIVKMIGFKELLPTSDFIRALGSETCTEKYPILNKFCSNILFLLCGFDEEQTNTTMIPVIAGHTPAGASVRQLLHYMQAITSGDFKQYDHGFIANLIKYGSPSPPKYPLNKINIPVAFYFGDNDYLSEVNDMHSLSEQIRPDLLIGKYRAPWKKFNHLDFIFAIDAKTLVFDKFISLLKRY